MTHFRARDVVRGMGDIGGALYRVQSVAPGSGTIGLYGSAIPHDAHAFVLVSRPIMIGDLLVNRSEPGVIAPDMRMRATVEQLKPDVRATLRGLGWRHEGGIEIDPAPEKMENPVYPSTKVSETKDLLTPPDAKPAEQDPRDKEIGRLRDEVKSLRKRVESYSISFHRMEKTIGTQREELRTLRESEREANAECERLRRKIAKLEKK